MKSRFHRTNTIESYSPAYSSRRWSVFGVIPKADKFFNAGLTTILRIQLVFTAIALVMGTIVILLQSEYKTEDIIELAFVTCVVIGAVLLLSVKKIGFYMIVLPNLLVGILGLFPPYNMRSVGMSFGEITLIMLLMLLRKNGRNAYQVLWNRHDTDVKENGLEEPLEEHNKDI